MKSPLPESEAYRRAGPCPLFCLLLVVLGIPAIAGDWPQWRGPQRDGHAAKDEAPLASLPADLKPIWRKEIGGGFSSPIVAAGKLIYLDASDGREVAHALEPSTGKEIWKISFAPVFEDEMGIGPRSTPFVDGDRLYAQSCRGEFRCLELATGRVVWGTSFEKDFGVKFLGGKANEGTAARRGNNGCGVIDGSRLFLPVGSTKASLACFDKMTGKLLWTVGEDEAAYSSILVATLARVRQAVYFSAEALMGIRATDGKILWRLSLKTNAKRHAATPVVFEDTVMVNSHTIGLLSFKIKSDSDQFTATQNWADRDLKINLATPVLTGEHLFSQGAGKEYVCVNARTGQLKWTHEGFGENYSATILVGSKLLVLTDRGELVELAADPERYNELGRWQICGKSWSHPAYSEGHLYVREGLTSGWKLSCFDLRSLSPTQ